MAELISIITCPKCGHKEQETMPENACQWLYQCKNCSSIIEPKGVIAAHFALDLAPNLDPLYA